MKKRLWLLAKVLLLCTSMLGWFYLTNPKGGFSILWWMLGFMFGAMLFTWLSMSRDKNKIKKH